VPCWFRAAIAARVIQCDMAVSTAHWFHYEVTITVSDGGEPNGTIVNRQAEHGSVPGLAGFRPTVSIFGDTLHVASSASEAPPHPIWDWVTAFVPFTHKAYATRRLCAAQVQSFALELPGLSRLIRTGCVLRLMQSYVPAPNNPFSAERHCEVVLLESDTELFRWVAPAFAFVDW
jgi:hypothetical protein